MEHVIERIEIGMHDRIPILARHRWKGVVPADSGIADHAVWAAVFFDVGQKDAGAFRAIGDIEHQYAR